MESRDERGIKLIAAEIRPLEDARQTYRPTLHVEVRAEDLSERWLEEVDAVLSSHPGECDVYLHIVMPDRSRRASRSRRYRVAEGDRVAAALRTQFPSIRVRWGRSGA